ncbi:MAG: pantoate--beta-alanine ligase [Phycisphaerae bacterium]
MDVANTIAECRRLREALGPDVAFVPTMGALHRGHTALIEAARAEGRPVVVSIFVNPTQFGANEDIEKYPRPLEEDLAACRAAGAAFVFNPPAQEMYPPAAEAVLVDVPALTGVLEGRHRPGHFRGVCRVVAKLFYIVRPGVAYFGRKDFQQLRVIEAMTAALDMPVQIVGVPTVRDDDGLALSSRNVYLTPDERARALAIPRALNRAVEMVAAGEKQTDRLLASARNILLDMGNLGHVPLSIDYIATVDPQSLQAVDRLEGSVLMAVAARVGNTRLIDNMLLEPPG